MTLAEAVSLDSWRQVAVVRDDDVEVVSQQMWTPFSVSLAGKTREGMKVLENSF